MSSVTIRPAIGGPVIFPHYLIDRKKTMSADTERELFGTFLRRRRTQLGLLQGQVAERGDLSQQYISSLERAAAKGVSMVPSRKTLAKIALGLGIPIAEVERAADLVNGTLSANEPKALPLVFIPDSNMRPYQLATGDILYISPDDQEPDSTVLGVEAYLLGKRSKGRNPGN